MSPYSLHVQSGRMTSWPLPVTCHYEWCCAGCCGGCCFLLGLLPPAALWRLAEAAEAGPVRDAAVLVPLLPHRLHPATWCQHGIKPFTHVFFSHFGTLALIFNKTRIFVCIWDNHLTFHETWLFSLLLDYLQAVCSWQCKPPYTCSCRKTV